MDTIAHVIILPSKWNGKTKVMLKWKKQQENKKKSAQRKCSYNATRNFKRGFLLYTWWRKRLHLITIGYLQNVYMTTEW